MEFLKQVFFGLIDRFYIEQIVFGLFPIIIPSFIILFIFLWFEKRNKKKWAAAVARDWIAYEKLLHSQKKNETKI